MASTIKFYIFKRKNGYYYLVISRRSPKSPKRHFKYISCKTKIKSEATKFLKSYEMNLLKETENQNSALNISFKEFEPLVLNYVKNNFTKGTYEIYYYLIKNFNRIIGDKLLKLITIKDIEFFKEKRLKEVKPATINIDLTVLKSMFNIAIRLNYLNLNPCNNVQKLSIPEKEILCFTEQEMEMILNNISNNELLSVVKLAYETGMRLNELCHLQIGDVDFGNMVIHIRNKENFATKTKKNRLMPINENISEILQDLLGISKTTKIVKLNNPNKKLFKYHSDYISHKFKDVLRKLNFAEKYHFHCLRHTFITNMINEGIPISHIQKLTGHTTIKSIESYIHTALSDLRSALNS